MGDSYNRVHFAAAFGTALEVAARLAETDDVDVVYEGRTALWRAVNARQFDSVEVLLAAGADPARPMMAGWSPARLSLLTERPLPTDEVLTPEEVAAVEERDRLVAALGGFPDVDGFSLACVAGIDADEAVRRLDATAVPADELPDDLDDWWEEPFGDDNELAVGVTDVPGGCVVMQPWYFNACTPVVAHKLSAGTVVYGMYANPKSGNQGRIDRDGRVVEWDLHPGGGNPHEAESSFDVLLTHLYAHQAVAYCCAYTGLRPTDVTPFTEPGRWLLLPDRDYWHA